MSGVLEHLDLGLDHLDFEPEQECDFLAQCPRVVAWRVTCQLCEGWGLVCEEHMRICKRRQDAEERRRGMRCPLCKEHGVSIMRFDPIISSSLETLW